MKPRADDDGCSECSIEHLICVACAQYYLNHGPVTIMIRRQRVNLQTTRRQCTGEQQRYDTPLNSIRVDSKSFPASTASAFVFSSFDGTTSWSINNSGPGSVCALLRARYQYDAHHDAS